MWISQFLLGRPGAELTFDLNPNEVEIRPAQIAAKKRTLSGRLKKWVFRTSFPTIVLSSDYFSIDSYNAMQSLLSVTDTMLSFKLRNGDLKTSLEICYQTDQNTVPIRENSAVLLSAALVAAGQASIITINGVYDNPAGTGTNYFTGGSYADASYTITLGTPLVYTTPVYVTYSYSGWLVEMSEIGAKFMGGHVDIGSITGWSLEGV